MPCVIVHSNEVHQVRLNKIWLSIYLNFDR